MPDPAAGAVHARIPRGALVVALIVALLGAAVLTLLVGVLATTGGTLLVSGVAGAAIGLMIASATLPGSVSFPGSATLPGSGPRPVSTAAALTRQAASRLAMGIAVGMILLAGLAVWILARNEGGVMDPIGYLWTTFGFGIPAQGVVALIAAAWGAANGPVRWRR